MPPVLDVTAGTWMFDATVFYNLETANFPVPIMRIDGRGRIATEVAGEIRSTRRGGYDPVPWGWQVLDLEGAIQLERYAALLRRWSATGREHRGEAASIALALEARSDSPTIFVTDDGVALRACDSEGVTATCTPQLLVACARAGWATADEALTAFEAMKAAGRRFVAASELNRRDFLRLCDDAP